MSEAFNSRWLQILLVEDNPGDVMLVREAMQENKIGNQLHHVGDGEAALRFLARQAPYEQVPRPDLILLDLNLPLLDGRGVLAAVKGHPDWHDIPVVIMTSSQAEADVLASYRLRANCYVVKPIDLDQFMHVVRSIEQFWVSIVRLPASH
ncbi:MAG: hypothetical protein RJA44_2185 [Pseudomonadota bacterium]|jgi:two-component system response regulator